MASLLLPFLASADDEEHSHGVQTNEVYLQRAVPANKAVRIAQLGIEQHGMVGRHCHSGDEIGIVAKGVVMLRVADGEYAPKRQGDWFKVVPNTLMTVKNDTDEAALLYSVLVVDDDGEWLKHDAKNCLTK